MLHVVIMAGGKGERFWPASRKGFPKQFLQLFGEGTLIQAAYQRATALTDPDSIYVVTGPDCSRKIREQLPGLPLKNLLVEPEGKNTAACIGLAAVFVESRDPDGVMVILPSDQRVDKIEEFSRVIGLGAEVAKWKKGLVTLGIFPSRPETGYGYLEIGSAEQGYDQVYKVKRFTEKPDLETAERFLKTKSYLWNSGIFIWKTSVILEMFIRYLPEHYRALQMIKAAVGRPGYPQELQRAYAAMESASIDYAILERADSVYVIPADIDWDDLGNWPAMRRVWESDDRGNVVQGEYLALDSRNNIVYSPNKRIVTLGVNDMIIAETEDCLFLLPTGRENEIKGVLERLRNGDWKECL